MPGMTALAPVAGPAQPRFQLGKGMSSARETILGRGLGADRGPRDEMVSSTRSRRPDWRGFRSLDTSTSTRIALLSSLAILLSLAVACLRNRSSTTVCGL